MKKIKHIEKFANYKLKQFKNEINAFDQTIKFSRYFLFFIGIFIGLLLCITI
jgi:hypothetical protein